MAERTLISAYDRIGHLGRSMYAMEEAYSLIARNFKRARKRG